MKISVITVCRNEASTIGKTILSVVGQTYPDIEYIVIDGGSTDGTTDIIRQYDDRIDFWVSEPDKGIFNAMNKGAAHAHGDYVIFMNSGDCFHDNRVVEKAVEAGLGTDGADIVEGYVIRANNGKRLREHFEDRYVQIFTDTISHQGSFIRKSLLERYPYDEHYKIVSDWKFWIQTVIIDRATYSFIDLNIAIQDMAGISSVNEADRLKERDEVYHEFFPQHVIDGIDSFFELATDSVAKYAIYLRRHHSTAYQIARKIVKRIFKVAKMMEK